MSIVCCLVLECYAFINPLALWLLCAFPDYSLWAAPVPRFLPGWHGVWPQLELAGVHVHPRAERDQNCLCGEMTGPAFPLTSGMGTGH